MWRTGVIREYSSYSNFGRDYKDNISLAQIVEENKKVNIPIPQIVEEIAEESKASIEWRNNPNLYFEEIKVFLG